MSLNKAPLYNFTPPSPSPSLSDLLITDVDLDSDVPDFAISPSSHDSDFSSCDSFEFSFYDPSCEPSEELCVADDVFNSGVLLPCSICKSRNHLEKPAIKMEPITHKSRSTRWFMFTCGSMRASSPEMDMRDIKKRANRQSFRKKNKVEVAEIRRSSVGWRFIRSLSCRAVGSVAVAVTTPLMSIV